MFSFTKNKSDLQKVSSFKKYVNYDRYIFEMAYILNFLKVKHQVNNKFLIIEFDTIFSKLISKFNLKFKSKHFFLWKFWIPGIVENPKILGDHLKHYVWELPSVVFLINYQERQITSIYKSFALKGIPVISFFVFDKFLRYSSSFSVCYYYKKSFRKFFFYFFLITKYFN